MFVFATVTPRVISTGLVDLSVRVYDEEGQSVHHNFMWNGQESFPSTDRSRPGYELALSLIEKAIERGFQVGNRLEYDLIEETV